MGVMTEDWPPFPPLTARPYRSDAERAEWDKVFHELRVEGEADREAFKVKLENWVDHYARSRGIGDGYDFEAATSWHKSMLRCAREMIELLQAVPFPFAENSDLFDDFVPDEPSPALVMLLKIEKELAYEPSPPRPAHRPKANYSDLEELVRCVAPIYRARTGRDLTAGNVKGGNAGPGVRLMRALLTIAGERPVDNAIQTAIRAYNHGKK
jgi:hypothetical protein